MKLKIVSPQLGLSPFSNLGGEVVDRETLKGLAKLGVEIDVLLPKDRPYPKIKNLQVTFAPIKHIVPPYLFNIFVFFYLWQTFQKKKITLIRIHNPYFIGPGAWLFKKLFSPKTLLVPFYHHFEKSRIRNLLDNFFIKKWDLILTGSEDSKREMIQRFKVNSRNIQVVYHGVLKSFKPREKSKRLVKKYGLKDKEILLFIGVLTKRKNASFLLDLLSRLKRKDVKLLICGQGPELKNLKKKTRVLGLEEQVVFLGFQKDLVGFYNLADIFVFPSLKEGFGLVVAEAMLCEKPVIVSSNSSLREIVDHKKNGFLAETNNLKDWQKKIEILLDNKKLRKELGKEGRRKILKSFSWEKAVQRTYKIYQQLVKDN